MALYRKRVDAYRKAAENNQQQTQRVEEWRG
jgi:hypothetical protein